MRSARCAMGFAAVTSVLACAMLLSGCAGLQNPGGPSLPGPSISGSPTPSSAPGESIAGVWVLTRGQEGSTAITPVDKSVTLRIDGASSGGNGGCNAFGATASGSTTGAFTIRVGIHTDMACAAAERNITEAQYFRALGTITTAALSDGELTLSGPDTTLEFTRSTS